VQPGPGGLPGNIEDAGDFRDGEAGGIAQNQDLAARGRKRGESALKGPAQFACREGTVGKVLPAFEIAGQVLVFRRAGRGERRGDERAMLAGPCVDFLDGNAEEPGGKALLRSELRELLHDGDEGFLSREFRVRIVLEQGMRS